MLNIQFKAVYVKGNISFSTLLSRDVINHAACLSDKYIFY